MVCVAYGTDYMCVTMCQCVRENCQRDLILLFHLAAADNCLHVLEHNIDICTRVSFLRHQHTSV